MAIPTVVAVGAVSAVTTGACTPGIPAGTAAGDLLLMFAESANEPLNATAGWSDVGVGVVQQATGLVTSITVRSKIAGAGETAPSVTSTPQNHLIARIVGVRGQAASPINITATGVDNTTGTAFSVPGATTTAANCLVFAALSTGTDVTSTTMASGWTNASLASPAVTEQIDNWNLAGNGGGIAVAAGGKATAGAYSATTGTLTTGNTKAFMSFAVAGAVPATSASADVAAATGAGLDATVSTTTSDTQASGDVAASSGAALDASSAAGVAADIAAGAGSSFDAATGASVTSGPAVAAGASLDAAADVGASAGVSAAAGASLDATAALSVGSDVAAGAGSALDASAAVSGSTTATAGPPTGNGAAFDALAAASVTTDVPTAAASAFAAAVVVAAAAEVAAGAGAAWDATGAVPVLVGYTRRGTEAAPTVRGQLVSV